MRCLRICIFYNEIAIPVCKIPHITNYVYHSAEYEYGEKKEEKKNGKSRFHLCLNNNTEQCYFTTVPMSYNDRV